MKSKSLGLPLSDQELIDIGFHLESDPDSEYEWWIKDYVTYDNIELIARLTSNYIVSTEISCIEELKKFYDESKKYLDLSGGFLAIKHMESNRFVSVTNGRYSFQNDNFDVYSNPFSLNIENFFSESCVEVRHIEKHRYVEKTYGVNEFKLVELWLQNKN